MQLWIVFTQKSKKKLAEFLAKFDIEDINSSFCKYGCNEKTVDGTCKHDFDCPFEDACVIEKWLQTKAK